MGRPTKWGNPFVIGRDGTRQEVVEKYRAMVLSRPEMVAAAKKELAGKDLICWCAPYACHADILIEIANEEEKEEEMDGNVDLRFIRSSQCGYCTDEEGQRYLSYTHEGIFQCLHCYREVEV